MTATTPNPPTPRLTAHQVAEILCEEAWQGRWNPLNQGRNTRPMAEHAAQVLTEALHRLGFAIVPDPDENGSADDGFVTVHGREIDGEPVVTQVPRARENGSDRAGGAS